MLLGVKIIEFEGLGPAPFAGRMLAELGADVLVIKNDSQKEKTPKNSFERIGSYSTPPCGSMRMPLPSLNAECGL